MARRRSRGIKVRRWNKSDTKMVKKIFSPFSPRRIKGRIARAKMRWHNRMLGAF